MKKHIVIAKLFEFGGSNSHLKTVIKYFGKENMILILDDKNQVPFLKNIAGSNDLRVIIKPRLHKFAHLAYPSALSNIKEFFDVLRSILSILFLSIKHGLADVTICVVEPEKYIYLLWLPFIKVVYILHSSPEKKYTHFTSFTCNIMIGKRKRIITVSNSNKNLIYQNWSIRTKKKPFVHVIYNCIIENELNITHSAKNNRQHIITLGHVIPYKNPALWLKVAKLVTSKYEQIQFVWLGNGPLWDDFKNATEGNDRIWFKGAVTDPMKYLKEAIIYYQPSLNETQGIAVVEAMYNHLPCVVSDTGGLPETVEHQYNGIVVNPTIVKEHVEALSILIDNSELRYEYGLNSHKRYLNLFSFDSFQTKMDALYHN